MPKSQHETTVTGSFGTSIPAEVRDTLDVTPGDAAIWELEADRVVVRFRRKRAPAFRDFKPFDFGSDTDATKEHDEVS